MSVDWSSPWGGDIAFTAAGDIVTLVDGVDAAPATVQRLYAMVLTNARQFDATGVAVSAPDDLFNPDYGASLPLAVGEPITVDLANAIAARIRLALAGDIEIASTPAPVIAISFPSQGVAEVDLTCVTVSGVPISLQILLEG